MNTEKKNDVCKTRDKQSMFSAPLTPITHANTQLFFDHAAALVYHQ